MINNVLSRWMNEKRMGLEFSFLVRSDIGLSSYGGGRDCIGSGVCDGGV